MTSDEDWVDAYDALACATASTGSHLRGADELIALAGRGLIRSRHRDYGQSGSEHWDLPSSIWLTPFSEMNWVEGRFVRTRDSEDGGICGILNPVGLTYWGVQFSSIGLSACFPTASIEQATVRLAAGEAESTAERVRPLPVATRKEIHGWIASAINEGRSQDWVGRNFRTAFQGKRVNMNREQVRQAFTELYEEHHQQALRPGPRGPE